MNTITKAYATRDGKIHVHVAGEMPPDAWQFAEGSIRDLANAIARMTKGTWQIPGLCEVTSEDIAIFAFINFRYWFFASPDGLTH